MADYDHSFAFDVACGPSLDSKYFALSCRSVTAWSRLSIKSVPSDAKQVSKGCAQSTTTMRALYKNTLFVTK